MHDIPPGPKVPDIINVIVEIPKGSQNKYDKKTNLIRLDREDVEEHTLKEIFHFFQVYKDLEGKKVQMIGWEGVIKAKNIIRSAIRSYKEQKAKQ